MPNVSKEMIIVAEKESHHLNAAFKWAADKLGGGAIVIGMSEAAKHIKDYLDSENIDYDHGMYDPANMPLGKTGRHK